jgi:fluoroacetyl-CoA thioesterase
MAEIPIGIQGESTVQVSDENAISFLEHGGARVLATPRLIGYLEWTCRNSVKPLLDEGFDTVGTHVDVRHLAATPIGMTARFHSEVIAVDGARIRFRVEAWDDAEKIAEGEHERFIIEIGRFARRLAKKSAS